MTRKEEDWGFMMHVFPLFHVCVTNTSRLSRGLAAMLKPDVLKSKVYNYVVGLLLIDV